ncbi:vacuolar protein sorting-associated protein 26-domain-containing protein [Pelagophyceae sp. CCMP2097]|nr:vacuolar protein sorting-associated protein 26-domain-containing protein [Pelagophyceae sp. CCMP2097]
MFGFGAAKGTDRIAVLFHGDSSRPRKKLTPAGEALPVFHADEPVRGEIEIRVPGGKRLDHLGVKIELVGQVEMFHDRGNFHDFTALVRELDSPGVLVGDARFSFDFSHAEKPYESYSGLNVRLRYFVRATVTTRNYTTGNLVKEQDFVVVCQSPPPPEPSAPIKMEVGIEECLHIEFEYDKAAYALGDIIIGKVYFLLVRIKIKHMELAIVRREACSAGPQQYNESETVTKFELMDGAPVRGECIPIRLFLSNFELTPTYRSVNNKFSVKYYLNLVLVDQEERRYFKQQEVTFYRQ